MLEFRGNKKKKKEIRCCDVDKEVLVFLVDLLLLILVENFEVCKNWSNN